MEFWDLAGIFEGEEDCTEHFQNTTGCGIRVKLAISAIVLLDLGG